MNNQMEGPTPPTMEEFEKRIRFYTRRYRALYVHYGTHWKDGVIGKKPKDCNTCERMAELQPKLNYAYKEYNKTLPVRDDELLI